MLEVSAVALTQVVEAVLAVRGDKETVLWTLPVACKKVLTPAALPGKLLLELGEA